ncbi:MAG: T9SS type A sorting domain-containing protein [Bacteroidota bacterium]
MKKTATFLKKQQSKIMLLLIASIWLQGASMVSAQNNYAIPDANFAAWLTANIPAAMSSGNMLDTTHADVLTRTRIDVENLGIVSLDGIQFFDSLKTLDCGNGAPSLNPNTLTSLPALPVTLDTLICGRNQLTSLPALPDSLVYLACYQNMLTALPSFSTVLHFVDCSHNQITALPVLPVTLTDLICDVNQLISLPTLPSGLANLSCSGNQLTALPALPAGIYNFYCGANQLTAIPTLPAALLYFDCTNNLLVSLPALPASLNRLGCGTNQLTTLPTLPNVLSFLTCSYNQLTSLPLLPSGLDQLVCDNNNITCFPVFPQIVDTSYFVISNNPFTCLPNYIPAMNSGTLAYPLCLPGNANGCPPAQGIAGYVFKDVNSDCMKNTGDENLKNIPVKIYDSSNNLVSQTVTALNGVYQSFDSAGTYIVEVDTAGLPFDIQCPYPGLDTTVVLTSLDTNVNFALTCRSGFDVGVRSVLPIGLVFPGQLHNLSIVAGDMTQWYNLNCAAGMSGTVSVTVNGPVTYVGPGVGALTPSVTGTVYTYNISDLASINNNTAFNLIFSTDTTAQGGDMVCVFVATTPVTDNNMSNNNYQFCYPVVNSHDPNIKEVYPTNVEPGYEDWLTYTIHFQNTGSAPAINIRLTDTLDANLNLETFEVLNYSHLNTVSLVGNRITVRYPNIFLPDSTTNLAGSQGFIQYRIKPKANLPIGTTIHNTAHIYFDYNAAVVTNTTENMFMTTVSVAEQMNTAANVNVFPNPFSDNTTFVIKSEKMNEIYSFEMIDVLGKTVKSISGISTKQFEVSRNGLESGIYFYKIYTSGHGVANGKVVIK